MSGGNFDLALRAVGALIALGRQGAARTDAECARAAAKSHLKKLGWSYRRAAPLLGVWYPHLSMVLNGRRESRRLLRAIAMLPPAPLPPKKGGLS